MTQPTRRQVLAGAALTAAASVARPARVDDSVVVKGIVVHDLSGDGTASAGHRGLSGILVSNGREVASTDSDGRWALPWRPGHGVFLIKPQGWKASRELAGLGHVWRHDAWPDQTIVFALVPSSEPTKFEVALLADTQPQTDLELDYLRDSILCEVARSGASFAINHGDVVFDDQSLYDRYLRLTAGTGMPWHHCPGNHDMNAIEDGERDRFKVWKRKIGPAYYAFEFGGCTFLVLNNVAALPPGGLTPTGYDYRGHFGADQLTFVRNLLARIPADRLLVVSMHIPLVSLEAPEDPASYTEDRDTLLGLLAARPHTVSFAGHTHTTEHHYLDLTNDRRRQHHHHVLTAASGSWWSGPFDHSGVPIARSRDGNPRGYHLMSIGGVDYTTRFVACSEANGGLGTFALCANRAGERRLMAGGRMVLEHPDRSEAGLTFNIFDGGPRTRVRFELARRDRPGTAYTMTPERQPIQCPFTAHHFDRHRAALKPWVEACPSSHVWMAPLPASLLAGVYTVTATIHDEYGRELTSSTLIEVRAG